MDNGPAKLENPLTGTGEGDAPSSPAAVGPEEGSEAQQQHAGPADDEMSGLSLPISSLHLLTALTLGQEGVSAELRLQSEQALAASLLLVVVQLWTLSAVVWAVALPSCSSNRQCEDSQYC